MHDRISRSDYDLANPRRSLWQRYHRPVLMLLVPLLLVAIGGYFWMVSGRTVSTDNAYVAQDKVSVSSDINGRVIYVAVTESQKVKRGDVLLRLDPEQFRIALAEAEAKLAAARLSVGQLRETVSGKGADVGGKREAVTYAEIDLKRQQELLDKGFTTRARLQQAEHALAQARSEMISAEADEGNARAALAGSAAARGDVENQPQVMAARAARDKAALDLRRTVIYAPVDGVVSQTAKVQTGQMVFAGVPTISLLVGERMWVEANFKETDLEHMRVGQPATVKFDAYPDAPLEGRVLSIGAGTGSEFSVLPAQNATGNWVKVVQRVPVRIAIDDSHGLPLLAGLSAKVTVDLQRR
jgi:membrane fusion protein (multidrug efflux system)